MKNKQKTDIKKLAENCIEITKKKRKKLKKKCHIFWRK